MERIKFQGTLCPYGYLKVESIPEEFRSCGINTAYDKLLGFVVLETFEALDSSRLYIKYTYQLSLCEGCTEIRCDLYEVWDFETYDLFTALQMANAANRESWTTEVVMNGR